MGVKSFFPGIAPVLAVGLIAACSRSGSSPSNSPVTYAAPGFFSCSIPGDWRVLERRAGAMVSFFGPSSGDHPNAAAIGIYRYPRSDYGNVMEYYRKETISASKADPLIEKPLGAGKAYFFSMETIGPKIHSRQMETVREEDYLIPDKTGFYALVYVCPDRDVPESALVFERLAQSFKLF
ncbi:MAG: hypothetical protein ACYCPQ_03890 [Elusimicrobiota bacterium]